VKLTSSFQLFLCHPPTNQPHFRNFHQPPPQLHIPLYVKRLRHSYTVASMDPNRPIYDFDDSDYTNLLRRSTRATTPAPEDHSTDHDEQINNGLNSSIQSSHIGMSLEEDTTQRTVFGGHISSAYGRPEDQITSPARPNLLTDGNDSATDALARRMSRVWAEDEEENSVEGGESAGNRRGSSAFSMGLGRSRRDTSGYHLSAEDGGPQADEWDYMSPSQDHASARARQEPFTPARNIFGFASAFARPDTQIFHSSRRTPRSKMRLQHVFLSMGGLALFRHIPAAAPRLSLEAASGLLQTLPPSSSPSAHSV
jgi:hypothetical protein